MKENLSHKHVKRGFLSFQGKIGKNVPDFPGKMTVFTVLTLLFHLSFPKIWFPRKHKNYISAMSSNRVICWKSS